MTDLIYYKLALSRAAGRDLSGAVSFARLALCLNPDNDKARRLLELCLYELGWSDGAPGEFDAVRALISKKKWRKAEAEAGKLQHQSVRVLMVRGCLLAAAGRYRAASGLFARALEKDCGNKAAREYLTETARRNVFFFFVNKEKEAKRKTLGFI